jgi:hypothetical protein
LPKHCSEFYSEFILVLTFFIKVFVITEISKCPHVQAVRHEKDRKTIFGTSLSSTFNKHEEQNTKSNQNK